MHRSLLTAVPALLLACGDSTGPSAPIEFASIQTGHVYSCGIADDGAAYCWGFGGQGQLGYVPTRVCDESMGTLCSPHPGRVTGDLRFASLRAGPGHTCGITIEGDAYCWGDNTYGQLGAGVFGGLTEEPVLVARGNAFASVVPGTEHTCALTPGGVAFCWGRNVEGQLGDGTQTDRAAPALVDGPLTFVSIALGRDYTCAVATGGAAYCWGRIAGTSSLTPADFPGDETFVAIHSQWFHVCGVTTAGDAYCWGSNSSGELGNDTASGNIPALVSGQLTFRSVTAGVSHSCGVTTGNVAYCWGEGSFGQLGNGQSGPGVIGFSPVPVSDGLAFAEVSAGGLHSCGLTTGGRAYCWGDNGLGQLGTGTMTPSATPVLVAGQP